MTDDSKATEVLSDYIKARYKGDNTPATVEMVAEIWAQQLLVHDMIMSMLKLHSAGFNHEQKVKAYQDLTDYVQKSLDSIKTALENLPTRPAGNNG